MTQFHKSLGASKFLERLKAEYERTGWDQATFARMVTERSGYPMKQPRVSEILRGMITRFHPEEIEALAIGLGVKPGDLVFGEGEEHKKTSVPIVKQREKEVKPASTSRRRRA